MTSDDIIRMATEAGLDQWDGTSNHFASIMERFAAIVAAAKEQQMIADGWRQCAKGQRTTQFCGLLDAAVKAEREACAKVCEAQQDIFLSPRYAANQPISSMAERFAAGQCAEAIRARGEQ